MTNSIGRLRPDDVSKTWMHPNPMRAKEIERRVPLLNRYRFFPLLCFMIAPHCFGARGADFPPGDHGGADLMLGDGDMIWGAHTGIATFTIDSGTTVTVRKFLPEIPGSGFAEIHAERIVIRGTFDATGAGHEGGSGSGGDSAGPGRTFRDGNPGLDGGGDGAGPWAGAGGTGLTFDVGGRGANGGYLGLETNGDRSTDESATMGSGGGGGNGCDCIGPAPFCGKGGGGGAGGAGGGYIKLLAVERLDLDGGWLLTRGTLGGNGKPGEELIGGMGGDTEPEEEGLGGLGSGEGFYEKVGPTGGDGGAGAGGAIVLKSDAPGAITLFGATLDARGGGGEVTNGGTIKILFVPLAPTGAKLFAGRAYYTFSQPAVFVNSDPAITERNGRYWETAFATIQEAIDLAHDTARDIWVAEGVYEESIALKSGVRLFGGFAGNEKERSERDAAAHPTVIDASAARQGEPAFHAVVMENVLQTRIDGFMIIGGDARMNELEIEPRLANGGGILVIDSDESNTIANCIVTGASAADQGGAMALYRSDPVITGCAITDNTSGTSGGGIACVNSSPTIARCRIERNTSAGGGGISIVGGDLQVVNTIVAFNRADLGAAILLPHGRIHATNCTIHSNIATSMGGGVFVGHGGEALLRNTIFSANSLFAVYEDDHRSDAAVINCLFHDNPDGDFFDESAVSVTGADRINSEVEGAMDNVSGDPMFIGADVGDFRLSMGSAAIDRGGPQEAPSADFAGAPRPVDIPGAGFEGGGFAFDIGAFELQLSNFNAARHWQRYP